MTSYDQIETIVLALMARPSEYSLASLADQFGISVGHLQKSFKHWVGITPKQFQQFLTVEYAKKQLNAGNAVLSTAFDLGLSSSSRLHDAFVVTTGLSPGEFKSPNQLTITYERIISAFGPCLVAETHRGICALLFETAATDPVADLHRRFKGAAIHCGKIRQTQQIQATLSRLNTPSGLRLHLLGTNFQLQVWQALMCVPDGLLCSYQAVADALHTHPRAIGQAVGANPISILIPCHRVLRQSADWGGYYWGLGKKGLLIGIEGHNHAARRGQSNLDNIDKMGLSR